MNDLNKARAEPDALWLDGYEHGISDAYDAVKARRIRTVDAMNRSAYDHALAAIDALRGES